MLGYQAILFFRQKQLSLYHIPFKNFLHWGQRQLKSWWAFGFYTSQQIIITVGHFLKSCCYSGIGYTALFYLVSHIFRSLLLPQCGHIKARLCQFERLTCKQKHSQQKKKQHNQLNCMEQLLLTKLKMNFILCCHFRMLFLYKYAFLTSSNGKKKKTVNPRVSYLPLF